MSLVGISLFSAYQISVTWVSSTDGSTLATTEFSTSTLSDLPAQYKSALSQYPNLVSSQSKCVISIPSDFPADECYDILRAFTTSKITPKRPFPPITHGQAYCATIPDDVSLIMFLDFSPSHISSECLLATFGEVDWQRQRHTKLIQKCTAALSNAQGASVQDALKKVAVYDFEVPLDRIVLNNPPPSLSQLIHTTLSTLHPNVPVTTATQGSISLAAATSEYIRLNLPPGRRVLAQYLVPYPVSIATSTGAAICLVPHTYKIPVQNQSVILTTSMDNQPSVTVRLLLGNHHLAEDNLERAIVILRGLIPMAKATPRIRITMNVRVLNGWRKTAIVTVQQLMGGEGEEAGEESEEESEEEEREESEMEKKKVVGLRKTFMFPRFFDYLDSDNDEKYETAEGNDHEDEMQWEKVVGDLPP